MRARLSWAWVGLGDRMLERGSRACTWLLLGLIGIVAGVAAADLELTLPAILVLYAAIVLLAAPQELLIAITVIGAGYRLPDPSLTLAGVHLSIPDTLMISLMLSFILRFRCRLFRVGKHTIVVAMLVSQFASNVVGAPLTQSLGGTIVQLVHAWTLMVVIMGMVLWLSDGGEDRVRRLMVLIFSCGVILAIQALVIGDSMGSTAHYAPTAVGTVVRLSGVAGNFLAGMLLLAVFLGFALIELSVGSDKVRLIAGAFLMLSVVVLTYTRGAYFDTIIGVVLYMYLKRGRRQDRVLRIGIGGILLLKLCVLTWVLVPGVGDRFRQLVDSEQGNTLDTRRDLWAIAINMVERHPIAGIGPGAFNHALRHDYLGILPRVYYDVFTYPEHQLLGLMAETGFLGLLLYIGGLFLAIVPLRSIRFRYHHRSAQCLALRSSIMTILICRLLSECLGTWFSGNEWLTMAVALALFLNSRDLDCGSSGATEPGLGSRSSKSRL